MKYKPQTTSMACPSRLAGTLNGDHIRGVDSVRVVL